MSTFVTVTDVNDEEPTTQVIEFSSPEAAAEFVAKVDGMYDSRTDARIDAEIVTPEFLIDDSIDSWIADNLEGFTKEAPVGGGAKSA